MEISNLLNKKASGDKEVPADGEGPEAPITKKEISLPILCNASNGSALGVPERTTSKLAQGSPAVARIAPQRAQISKQLKAPGPPKEWRVLLQSGGEGNGCSGIQALPGTSVSFSPRATVWPLIVSGAPCWSQEWKGPEGVTGCVPASCCRCMAGESRLLPPPY